MAKINKIKLSGTSYDIQDLNASKTVELTQAQYDALVTKDPNTFYIITDAQGGDLSNYYTKSETSGATEISTALSGKQDTLIAGSGITISGNVISAEGGGGGKAIEGGRGISITTGETADTVSFNLPISAGTGSNSLVMASNEYGVSNRATGNGAVALNGDSYYPTYATGGNSLAQGTNTKAMGYSSHAEGNATSAVCYNSHAEGQQTLAGANYQQRACHAEGYGTSAMADCSHAEGTYTKTTNHSEHASGKYNVSSSASTTFGDSGNTLFSVGNGTADNARHNAFEIRQNGDIYCSDGTNDVKLQDTITATAANTTALGGLSLVKLTQAEYDALVTKDSNTLYVIVD